jgi:hypothetical protein
MLTRLSFALLTAFWLTMMVLLWRSEFGAGPRPGSAVPAEAVWERILTAPDASSLQIKRRGTNVGYCRWSASVGQERSAGWSADDDLGPEGLVEQPTSYTLDLDGSVALAEFVSRLGYSFTLKLSTNQTWQELHFRLKLRPDLYEVRALAAEQTIQIHVESAEARFNRTFKFSDFQNPQTLLRTIGGPLSPGLLAMLGLPMTSDALARLSLGLRWQGHQDWLKLGHSRVRVYRLQAQLLDRYRATVYVSPVGEILRLELPGDFVAVNDALTGFGTAP